MRKLPLYFWAVLILSGFLLSGCFGKVSRAKYYLLEYVPTPSKERLQKGPYNYSARIKDFSIAEAFRRNQIVYRQSAHELLFYNYHLWAVKPEYLVSDMMFRHIREAQLFQTLTKSIERSEPDFVLTGEVTSLEEYDNDDQWFAHLAMTVSLISTRTQEVVWSKPYDFRKKVNRQEPVYVVRELSFLLETIANDVVGELDLLLENLSENQQDEQEYKQSLPPQMLREFEKKKDPIGTKPRTKPRAKPPVQAEEGPKPQRIDENPRPRADAPPAPMEPPAPLGDPTVRDLPAPEPVVE